MSKVKHTRYPDYEDGDAMIDDEEFDDSDIDIETNDEDIIFSGESSRDYKRSWRDTEKYKEMRELYKLINDELYIGFNEIDFLENDY